MVALGLCHPACRGSWGLAGHNVGHPAQPWPGDRCCVWELWFSLYPATSHFRTVAAHGQRKGAPTRSCCHMLQSHADCRDMPPNSPIIATLRPVCSRQDSWDGPGWSLSGSPTSKCESGLGIWPYSSSGTSRATSSQARKARLSWGSRERVTWFQGVLAVDSRLPSGTNL